MKRFRAKWAPVRVKKTRQNKNRESGFDFIKAGKALALAALCLAFAGTARAETITVTIGKATFGPAAVSAHVGDVIVWDNKDIVAHTATARDKAWDVMIPAGKTARIAMKKAGTIEYYCRFHPNMVGKLTVVP
ncbi:MAG: cupredoxin domain-containing protein [Xanthobacteraceae bacterium]|uniref:cupredoxin domain-containing protein n=1 Tax=Pseudolabrys sp. TaxID=1960880 RepID=UPI003D127FB0